MSDPICQLLEDIEGLCKRCYHLQKSNNEMYDFLDGDRQMQEYIDENEKIIEKYHRKMNEMLQLIKENSTEGKEISWSPIALDYKKMEDEEKRQCDAKKQRRSEKPVTNAEETPDDKGVYL